MAGIVFAVGAVKVFVGAEDHLPPHVHAYHTGEQWLARFRFSFLSDITGLYRFRRRGRRPMEAVLNHIADEIIANLPGCREEWWNTHGDRHGIGLVNRRVETRPVTGGDKVLAKVAVVPARTAIGITAAAYNPGSAKVTLNLADGSILSLTAGQHIEEAEEW
jgi:hypothetical protein